MNFIKKPRTLRELKEIGHFNVFDISETLKLGMVT